MPDELEGGDNAAAYTGTHNPTAGVNNVAEKPYAVRASTALD